MGVPRGKGGEGEITYNPNFFVDLLGKSSKKKRSFYGQADRKGGAGSALSALTVSKCENFGPIFPIIKW